MYFIFNLKEEFDQFENKPIFTNSIPNMEQEVGILKWTDIFLKASRAKQRHWIEGPKSN